MDKYSISFNNLENGEYTYKFDLDKKFFGQFETSEIDVATLKAEISFSKKDQVRVLNFKIEGTIQVECDRCLDLFDLPVSYSEKLYVKYGTAAFDKGEDTVVISASENELNVAQYLYEFSVLSLPYKRVHPDKKGKSTCNPEMIKKLNELSLQESNESENNPWNDLKKLIN